MADFEPQGLRNEADYERALKDIAQYFRREPNLGSPEAEHFDLLAGLIAAYEEKYWPIEG